MAQERKNGEKMHGKGEELPGKARHVWEFLTTTDHDSNSQHLPAHVLPGAGLRFKDSIPHSLLTRSWWDTLIKD